jgi:hypothetical protein
MPGRCGPRTWQVQGRGALARARRIAGSIFYRQRQLITLQRILCGPPKSCLSHDAGIRCVTVDSLDAIDAIADVFPTVFRDSVAQLRERVAQGCVLSVALRSPAEGRVEVVGYELAERGVFSALGRRYPAPGEIVFSHWAEVLPQCRGQRIHARLFAARDAYFAPRGGRFVCGVVLPKNHASLRALHRAGSLVVGAVTRLTLFGRLVIWETPPERIARTLKLTTS